MSGASSQHVGFLPPWDGPAYAANTAHHRRHDEAFLASLPLRPDDRVLDLGCGAGDLTAIVADLVPEGHVVGVDAQPSMVAEAQRRARPNQSFVVAPAQLVGDALAGERFDVVMSRAVLHWIPRAEHGLVLDQLRGLLRPGGALRVECGGGDNVREIVAFCGDVARGFGHDGAAPWAFADAGEQLDLLLAHGFDVEGGFVRTVAQRRPFDRESVQGWLHSQCLNAYEATIDRSRHAELRAAIDARIDELRRDDGSYDLTFVRLDVLAFSR